MSDYVVRFKEDPSRHEPLVVMATGGEVSDQQDGVIDSNNNSNIKKNPTTSGRPKRGQANRRERVRTENVNAGFDKLRKLIPTDPEDRKLSKIEILRLATSYIKHLYNLTQANSCLEADYLDLQESSEDEDDLYNNPSPDIIQCRAHRNHVCTFCLMMTKVPKGG